MNADAVTQLALEPLDKLNKAGWHNTVSLMRGVFLPYKKIGNTKLYKDFIASKRTLSRENNHIEMTVTMHPLTQIHANILDVMMTKLNSEVSGDGYMYVECSLYELQNQLGFEWKNDTKAITKFLSQMVEATIWIKNKTSNVSYAFHIIEKFYKEESTGKFIIVFASDFIKSYFKDMLINYRPLVDTILSFKYPVNQAMARFIISQKHINISIMNLLQAIGIDIANLSRKEKSKLIKHVLNEEEKEVFGKLGIAITRDDTFVYAKNQQNKKKVYFSNKLKGLNPIGEELK